MKKYSFAVARKLTREMEAVCEELQIPYHDHKQAVKDLNDKVGFATENANNNATSLAFELKYYFEKNQ